MASIENRTQGRNSATLIIQDNVYAGSLHLDEVLLSAIPSADEGAAAFAFATKSGLNAVFNSDEFRQFCDDGHHFELYLGIDSVTDEGTLRFAKELSGSLGGRLIVRVYYNPSSSDGISHPKTSWFRNADGSGCLSFVGSGNLTMRGLQSNVEMFSWIEQDVSGFSETVGTWNAWIAAAAAANRIYDVDDPVALERAKENHFEGGGFRKSFSEAGTGEERRGRIEPLAGDSLVVSCIPRQTGRGWTQFAMKKAYYTDYFGFELDETGPDPIATGSHRVLLRAVDANGTVEPAESRAGNVSSRSRNFRIELEAARSVPDYQSTNPVVVFLQIGPRDYLYQIFDSESPYNSLLQDFAREHGLVEDRNYNPKCRVNPAMLREVLPDLPILNVKSDAYE